MTTPASPCINVCVMDEETGYCKGCFRTLSEVAGWPSMSESQKEQVLSRLSDRRKQVN